MSNATTAVSTLPPGGEPPEHGRGARAHLRRHLRWYLVALAALVVVGLLIASFFVSVGYYTLSPGSVYPTQDIVVVDGAESYPDTGDIGFTTVSVRPASAFETLLGWMDSSVQLVEEEVYLGGRTEEENREESQAMMVDSQQVAIAVALEQMGYDVVAGSGAEVLDVSEGLPADGLFEPGDVIVAVDGTEVELWEEVVAALSSRAPGDTVELVVEDDEGQRRTVTPALVSRCEPSYLEGLNEALREEEGDAFEPVTCDAELEASPVLGLVGATRDQELDFPFEVTIDAGEVLGPSAGLAFTLAVLDTLTPGDLTGGAKVATTGTMALDGHVGPVGGAGQKTVAARRAGVEIFLVPPSEYDEAVAVAGDMEVVAVTTIGEAVSALEARGGDTEVVAAGAAAPRGS